MKLAISSLFILALATHSFAEDKKDSPIDGTWRWTYKTPEGQSAEVAVKLKAEGEKLSGVFVSREGKEEPITEGTFKDNQLAFTVVRTVREEKMTFKYSGKLDKDTITGKIDFVREGQPPRPREWEAKRVKA
jgi:hypothetical protein